MGDGAGELMSDVRMLDRSEGSAHGVFTATVPQAKVAGLAAWDGPALICAAELDAGVIAWPAADDDLDIRWTATVHPHHFAIGGTSDVSEVLWAPGAGEGEEYLEPAFTFGPDGIVRVSLDWGATLPTADVVVWESAPVGDWRVGIPEANYRLTVDKDDGDGGSVFTAYKDGVVVNTETLVTADLGPFEVAPVATDLYAGNRSKHLVALKSAEMRGGIGGAVLYSFAASNPTGWTPGATLEGAIYAPPEHPSFYTHGDGRYAVPDPAVFDIGAADSVTWVWRGTLPADGGVVFERDAVAVATAAGPGWLLVDSAGFGLPHAFAIRDADGTISVDFGAFTGSETTVAVTLDRGTDALTAYRDGVAVDTVDASALGAVVTDADVTSGLNLNLLAVAGFARRALSPAEHLALHYELANAA